nr:8250_t:CDS:10 [Entrophospora candida]
MDTSSSWQVLDKHSQFLDITKNPEDGYYYYIKVSQEKIWVPILPGFIIFTNIKNSLFKLSISITDNRKILFSWLNFGEIKNDLNILPNIIASNSESDRFQSLITYTYSGKRVSLPYLLGLNIPGIVQQLVSSVYQKYSYLYPSFHPISKTQEVTEKMVEVIQKKGNKLQRELEITSSDSLVCEGLLVTTEKKNVDYKDFMALLIEHKRTKQQLTINDILEESKLGLTILINTEKFLSLILQQSCSYCGEIHLLNKKITVSTAGFVVKIHVKCKLCKTVSEFINKSETNFDACVAAAGLVGGTNRQSLQMILACVGITLQLKHHKTQGKQIIPVSFDCSWSHVHNAQQASGEMIYDGRDVEGYLYVVEKPRKMKMQDGEEIIIQEEQDMLLNVTIDGDLDSNKTLGNVGIINQQHIMTYFSGCVYAAGFRKANEKNCNLQEKDIQHVQIEGLFQHLCDNHDLCWPEVCWIKQNPEVQLKEPTLKVHALAILHNNEGICEMVSIVRQACMAPLSSQDLFNIAKIEEGSDFDEVTKCLACHSFPKCTARGLCRLCRFYVDNGLKDQIVDKNFQSKIEVSENIDLETMCESALDGIFGFSDFHGGQKEAILSFAQNHDTLVLKKTGGGKSLCYALASVITTGITVVFSPLKALIDDQVLELTNAGIPCCGLYASTSQPDNKERFLEDILKIINEIEVGKCIIYCASVKGCENLLSELQDKVAKEIIAMYHDVKLDMQKMLKVIDEITKVKQQVTGNDVVDVFRQSQAKDIKNQFGHLPIYQEKFSRILKTKEDAFLLLDDLVLRKLVEEDIILTKSLSGQTFTCSIFIFGIAEDALTKANNQNWIYLVKI